MPEEALLGSDHVNGLTTLLAAFKKGMEATRKEGEGTEQLTQLETRLKEYGDFDQKLKDLVPLASHIPLADKRFVNLKANILKATDDARKTFNLIVGVKTKKWTVETNSKVTSWVSKHHEPSLARVVGDIRTSGMEAGGLKNVSGTCYHVYCAKPNDDYRLVGVADIEGKNFKFEAVYRHPKSGGKEFVDGNRVSVYG